MMTRNELNKKKRELRKKKNRREVLAKIFKNTIGYSLLIVVALIFWDLTFKAIDAEAEVSANLSRSWIQQLEEHKYNK